jgi:hypothetical protein
MDAIIIDEFVKDIAFYAGITTALVTVLKISILEKLPKGYLPLISLVIGTCLGLFVLGWSFILSLMIGLTSTGAWEVIKRPTEEVKKQIG